MCYKDNKGQKNLWELPKEQNAFSKIPLANSIFKTPTRSKSCDGSFLTEIEDYNYMFWT